VRKSKSICPICQKKIDSELVQNSERILITKKCKDHGDFSATHWQSATVFDFANKYDSFQYFEDLLAPKNPEGCPYICESCDKHASDTVIGVIDVTKRCDLRCAICFSTFSDHEVEYEPSKESLINMLTFLSQRNPKPPAILFSGGEPLQREDMHEIVDAAHRLRFMTIVATNGVKLSESPEIAAKLKENGLNIVYLQFDSFNDDFYQKIRGKKLLDIKMKAIEVCRKHDIEIILVNSLMRSYNDKEVGDIVRFAARNSDIIRGVIFQPVAFTGRATENPFREALREWRFVEDVENQTEGQIMATDFFPMSVMVSPIMMMRKFMKRPWPLFSCSPQCGLVNWMYVSKNGKVIPINHFVDFERFFNSIQKTARSVESKGRFTILATLFLAAMRSLNWPLVTKEIGFFPLMTTIMKTHISPTYQSLGKLRRRIILLGCMAFMDQYNFDVNRVRRCVVHYITPDLKIVPFCAYNNVHRISTEEEYVARQNLER
jgi:7,8-dihydro-6-hydroxymethylpterin dimethyltransferase